MPQACNVFNKTKKLFLRRDGESDKLLGWSYEEGSKAYVTKLFYLLATDWKEDVVIVQGDHAKVGDVEFISPKELGEYKEKVVKVPNDFRLPKYFCLTRGYKGGVRYSYVDISSLPELKVLIPFLMYNSNGRAGGDVNIYGDDLEVFDESFQILNPLDSVVKAVIDRLLSLSVGSRVSFKDQKPKLKHPNDASKDLTEMLLLVGFYVDADLKQKYPKRYLSMLKQIRNALNTRQANVFNNIDLSDLEIEDTKVGNLVHIFK